MAFPFMTPEHYDKIRMGLNRFSVRPTDIERGALFVRRRPLRPMRVMVDFELNDRATHDERLAFLMGLLVPSHNTFQNQWRPIDRFWYSDSGVPSEVERKTIPGVRGAYAPGWVLVTGPNREEAIPAHYMDKDRPSGFVVTDRELSVIATDRNALPPSYAAFDNPYEQLRSDRIAARAADSIKADIYITQRDYLLLETVATRIAGFILRPEEALPLIGLYLRQQGEFTTFATPSAAMIRQTDRASFFRIAADDLLPSIWRWRAACKQNAPFVDNKLLWLTNTITYRLAQVLRVRDDLHATMLQPPDDVGTDDVWHEFDHLNLLLMAAFDNAARVADVALGLNSDPLHVGWRKRQWKRNVASADPHLYSLFCNGSRGGYLLDILGSARNVIHYELPSTASFQREGKAIEHLLALAHDSAGLVTVAMDALGGQSSWGIESFHSPMSAVYFRPAPFMERLIETATSVLNSILAATPVERLAGGNLKPEDLIRPVDPNDRLDPRLPQRIMWQLGL